jgi:glycosyltransferase involved in cell wall biosynthesis
MKKMGIESPVLLIWHPQFLDMLDFFPNAVVVYYVYDNLTGYIGGDDSRRYEEEDELLRRADVTFVLSQELLNKHAEFSANIHLLPNAVDYDLFSTSRAESTQIPDELSQIPGPRIGYIGTINEKVDLEILEEISAARPAWSIVLIGRDNYQRQEERQRFLTLLERDNVFRFGYREYATIPSYIKGLDVCMMCYVINDWTFYGDPSKMHEYLASGKPTIATALPAIKEFSDVIDIPDSKKDWVSVIDKRLNEQCEELSAERIDVAKQNSYQARVRRAIEVLGVARDKRV